MQRQGEPTEHSLDHEGLRVSWLDWGGDGPAVVLLHPNGGCAGMFDPIARRLAERFRVVGVDLRGHGGSTDLVEVARLGFDDMARDVVAVLRHLGIDRVKLCGVSMGGGVAAELSYRHPELVDAQMLCEAIAFPDIGSATGRRDDDNGDPAPNPMVELARNRARVWPDRATVFEKYTGRGQMAEMHPSVLRAYVRWGFRRRRDGQIELACDPETEAIIFSHDLGRYGPGEVFAALNSIDVESHVLSGADTYLKGFDLQAKALGVDLDERPGAHFFLFTDPEESARLIIERLG